MTTWSPYADNNFDEMTSADLEILYEDDDIIAVNKPAGLLVHVGWGKEDVVLVDLMRPLVQGESVHTIHRIDRPTSGVVLFAQHPEAARRLRVIFDEHQIDKGYLALVRGRCPDQGWIDYAIPKERKSPERIEAQSAFRRLWFGDATQPREVSLVHVAPQTGRVHQIRRHLRHLNHPLIGDANYGRSKLNKGFRENYGLNRLALHAHTLTFKHPMNGEQEVHITAPVPPDLQHSFTEMGMPPTVYIDLHQDPLSQWVGPLKDNKDAWITE